MGAALSTGRQRRGLIVGSPPRCWGVMIFLSLLWRGAKCVVFRVLLVEEAGCSGIL